MTDIASKIGKKVVETKIKSTLSSAPPKTNKEIDWKDFNHPPLIKVFHFSLDEIEEEHQQTFKFFNYYFLSFFGLFILNFINSIIQVSVGYTWTRIFSSFFYYCILIGLASYGFYNLFKEGVTLEATKKTLNRVSGRK